ncbi:MAG: trypsin-like peptidase domain-containing protein [Planctomycetota bacterium]|nr:trypsin-like peptidase domain-containing protein [Planctomycetota bacterium]
MRHAGSGWALGILALGLLVSPSGAGSEIDGKVKKARDKVFPALVNVRPILELYHGGEKVVTGSSIGSGVIFSAEGHVLTNFHVAGHAEKVILTLGTKERVHGKVIGGDPWTDLAVVQLSREDWEKYHPGAPVPYAKLGDSAKLEVGEAVLAMGSPRGLSRSVSMGIVSNTERYLGDEMTLPTGERTGMFSVWIQTDAAINPGNSGGPLVNLKGEVVGINSRVVGNSNNLGFALPIDHAKQVVAAILSAGKVTRSNVGARLQELQELEELLGSDSRKGVLVTAVEPSSPAEAAGIEAGDVIVAFDGQEVSARFVEDLPAIYDRVARWEVGSKHAVSVQRKGRNLELSVVSEELAQAGGKETEIAEWGMTVRDLTEAQKRDLDVEAGVLVTGTKAGGLASLAKLENGDVIQFVDQAATPDVKSFRAAVEAAEKDRAQKGVVGLKDPPREGALHPRAEAGALRRPAGAGHVYVAPASRRHWVRSAGDTPASERAGPSRYGETRTMRRDVLAWMLALAAAGGACASEKAAAVAEKLEPSVVQVSFQVVMENDSKRKLVAVGTVMDAAGLIAISGDLLPRQMPDDRFADFAVKFVAADQQPSLKAELVTRDQDLHVALVKLAEDPAARGIKLVPAVRGDPRAFKRGDKVFGFGLLPSTYQGTLNVGDGMVVKVVDHPQELVVISGDASLALFGPVANAAGELVGFVVQDPLFERTRQNNDPEMRPASVFLPVTRLADLLEDPTRKRSKGWLGVSDMQPLGKDVGQVLGLSGDLAAKGGVIVGRVLEGQPAAKAGLKVDDIIVELGGSPVEVRTENDLRAFMDRLKKLQVGEEVRTVVLRAGKPETITVAIGERPKEESEAARFEYADLGLVLRELVYYDRLGLDLPLDFSGLHVHYVKSGSSPELGGLRGGDIITKIDDLELKGRGEEAFAQLKAALDDLKHKHKKQFVFFVSRGPKGQNSAFIKVETDWGESKPQP